MNKKQILVLIVILFLCYFGFYTLSPNIKMKASYLYNKMTSFQENGKWDNGEEHLSVSKGSAEDYFLQAINYYEQKDIKNAEKYLKKASSQNYTDVAFPVYLNFYLNQCEVKQKGRGNIAYITKILDYIQTYPILANDTDFIWRMISTILTDKESRQEAIGLLNNYSSNAKKLNYLTVLKLKGNMAVLKMMNENYADSVYDLHEIITKSKKIKDETEKKKIQIKAQEYIANVYFNFEDYGKAIEQYNNIIHLEISNPETNAIAKYGAYVNRISVYIEQKNYQKASKGVEEAWEIIPFLGKDIKNEVEIFLYYNMALIEIREKNEKQAADYIKKCNKQLKKSKNQTFLNNDMHVALTYCELLASEGKRQKAIKKLDELLIKNEKEDLDFEKTIYALLIDLYKETDQVEKYIQANDRLRKIEQKENKQIKKDYIHFAEESYKLSQLKKKERVSNIIITILIGLVVLILAFISVQLVQMRKLKENGRNQMVLFNDKMKGKKE